MSILSYSTLLCAAIFSLFSVNALAANNTTDDDSFFIGADYLWSDINHKQWRNDEGYRVYGGWYVDHTIGLEASYSDLGTFTVNDTDPAQFASVKTDILEASLAMRGNLFDDYQLLASFNIGFYHAKLDSVVTAQGVSNEARGILLAWGLSQPLTSFLNIDASARHYHKVDGMEINTYNLGLKLVF